jgi:hypothetical protein
VPEFDLKTVFPDADPARVAQAGEILRPYTALVPITIEGNRVFLPNNNSLWRGMQFWGVMTGEISIDFSLFCIAGTCKNCKSRLRLPGNPERVSALACQTQVQPGLEVVRLPMGFLFRKRHGRPWDALQSPPPSTPPASGA